MAKNCFESVFESVEKNGRMEKFSPKKLSEYSAEFSKDDVVYVISYDVSSSLISLFLKIEDSEENKKLASWLLDFEKFTSKDVTMISNDFIDIMAEKPSCSVKSKAKKKIKSEEEGVTPLFFANRMANAFSELKPKIQEEKEQFGGIRAASFSQNEILPCIERFISEEKNERKLSKFGKLLSDLYHDGDLSVRSMITIGILCRIEDASLVEKFKKAISDELKKAWVASNKYKDKKVKPEKINKRKTFMTRMLESQ